MKKYRCLRCGAAIKKDEEKKGSVRCGVCGSVGLVNERGFVVPLYESEDFEPDDVTVLGHKYTVEKHPSNYKIDGSVLVSFKKRFGGDAFVPDGVTEIADGAFSGAKIDRAVLPSSLTKIGARAFENSAVSEVVAAGKITEIGEGAFRGCKNLLSLAFKTGLKVIGKEAFARSGLITVCLPGTLTHLGEGAFRGCTGLIHTGLRGVGSIGKGAYEGCTAIAEAVLPVGVEVVSESAFKGCTSLVKAVLPEGTREVGGGAFFGCEKLAEVVLPESLVMLGTDGDDGGGFEGCKRMRSETVSRSRTSILRGFRESSRTVRSRGARASGKWTCP